MERFFRLVTRSILLTTVSIFFAGIAVAQDVLSVGSAAVPCITGTPGTTVTVPVFIRDVSGTPLGVDMPAASRIQAVSFQVIPTNPSAIAVDAANRLQITFTQAGVTAGLTPLSATTSRTATSSAFIVSFDQTTDPLLFTSNMAAPGNLFVNMNVQIAPGATPGTVITLAVNPAAAQTQLSNQAGTTSETTVNGGLAIVSGCILIPGGTTSLTCPAAFSAGTSANATVMISAAQGTDTTFALSSGTPGVATVPANVVILAGMTSATFPVTGVSGGTSTITATPPAGFGAAQMCTATVNAAPPSTSLTCPPAFSAGTSGTATVTISVAQGTATTITLSSGTPGVATVPANVVIPAGMTSATFQITGVSAGTSMIMATPPAGLGTAQTCTATVTAAITTSLTCPAAFPAGTNGTATVTISAATGTATTIALASGTPGVATVPANVVIAAGATSATFSITGVSAGTSTITATPPAGFGTAQNCTATVTVAVAGIPAIGPFGLLLLATILALRGFFFAKTGS